MRSCEPLTRSFRENGGRERPEDFAVLDSLVQNFFHLRAPRIGDDTPVAERSRTPFGASLKPPENFPVGDNRGSSADQVFFWQFGDRTASLRDTARADSVANLRVREARTPVSVIHHKGAWLPKNLVPHVKCGSDRESSIPRSGLYVNLFEWRGFENFPVGHAIERHSAGKAQRLP